MKAVAVIPGKANSIDLAELPKSSVHEIPNGRGVLVQVLRVGVDGMDMEINAAEYGRFLLAMTSSSSVTNFSDVWLKSVRMSQSSCPATTLCRPSAVPAAAVKTRSVGMT